MLLCHPAEAAARRPAAEVAGDLRVRYDSVVHHLHFMRRPWCVFFVRGGGAVTDQTRLTIDVVPPWCTVSETEAAATGDAMEGVKSQGSELCHLRRHEEGGF